MNTAVINVKVDPKVKSQAQAVAEELGLSLSALIQGFIKQLVRQKSVTFSLLKEEPTEYLLQALKESKEDIKAGRVVSFDNSHNAVNYLENFIHDKENSKN